MSSTKTYKEFIIEITALAVLFTTEEMKIITKFYKEHKGSKKTGFGEITTEMKIIKGGSAVNKIIFKIDIDPLDAAMIEHWKGFEMHVIKTALEQFQITIPKVFKKPKEKGKDVIQKKITINDLANSLEKIHFKYRTKTVSEPH